MGYSPSDYWRNLHRRGDLSAVGQSALPPGINRWLYAILARNLRAFVRRHGLDRPLPATVFDVGAGTGYWVRFWHTLGVMRVDGCDLVPEAVERLIAEASASGRADVFVAADVTDPAALPGDSYPLVSCMNVLLHVTEDAAFERALANVARLVAPGGHLLLVEPILLHAEYERPYDPAKHSRARPLARYRDPLAAAGLELVDLRAATVLANNPIEAGSPAAFRRYGRWWGFVSRRTKASPASARWIGPLVSALDRVAMRTGAAPTSKVALFRRPTTMPG